MLDMREQFGEYEFKVTLPTGTVTSKGWIEPPAMKEFPATTKAKDENKLANGSNQHSTTHAPSKSKQKARKR